MAPSQLSISIRKEFLGELKALQDEFKVHSLQVVLEILIKSYKDNKEIEKNNRLKEIETPPGSLLREFREIKENLKVIASFILEKKKEETAV